MLFVILTKKKYKNRRKEVAQSWQQYLLKSPDMARFFKNGANKENLFNLIETAFIQDKVRLGRRCFSLILIIVQRSPKVRCLKYQNNLWEENYFPVNLDDVFTN